MKILFFILGLACFSNADVSTNSLRLQPYQMCNYWSTIRDSSGFPAYACASSPQTTYLPEGYALVDTFNALEAKIQSLEKRIYDLEHK